MAMKPTEQIAAMPGAETGFSTGPQCAPKWSVLAAARGLQGWLRPSLLATIATNFATFGIAAIQGIILARLLGPESRGEFGTAVLFTYTLTSIGLLGTQFAVARRAANDPSRGAQLAKSVVWLGLLTGGFTILVVAALAYTSLPAQKLYLAPLCLLGALVLPLEQTRLLLLAIDQGRGIFWRFNLVNLFTSTVFPISLFILWLTGTSSVVAAVIAMLIGPAIGLALWFALADARPRWADRPFPKPAALIREGWPYWISGAVCDLFGRLDQFLFLCLGTFVAQGLYAAAGPAANLLLVGASALALFSFNASSHRDAPLSLKRLVQGGALAAAFQLIMGCLLAVVVGPLILLLYGREFAGAVAFALVLIPAQAINGYAQVVEGHLRGRGKVRVGILARIGAAILMIAIVLATFDRLHELSIPLAACVANGLVAVTLTWFAVIDVRSQSSAAPLLEPHEALA